MGAISETTFWYQISPENYFSFIEISLKFVSKGPVNKMSQLVQIIAWRQTGDKPLSEPMMV